MNHSLHTHTVSNTKFSHHGVKSSVLKYIFWAPESSILCFCMSVYVQESLTWKTQLDIWMYQ